MCLTPINLRKVYGYDSLTVPCGKCLECKMARTKSWFVRLTEELKHATSAYFVTFTYSDEMISFFAQECYSDNGLLTLNYRHFQLFMKRARKLQKSKIKYYTAGEYGSQTFRPHYHAIVFNVEDIQAFINTWDYGHCHVGSVSEKSIYYTLKYVSKGILDSQVRDKDDDRKPEKALMSKNLGLEYLSPAVVKYLKDDVSRNYMMLGGTTLPLPRYYKDKIYDDFDRVARKMATVDYLEERYQRISDPLFPQRVKKMYDKVYNSLAKTD
ncbi:hypothetical protein CMT37_17000 [Elizabethkingia anophelis]|nr:hypothetical protein [Elizabethkingia anophelis]